MYPVDQRDRMCKTILPIIVPKMYVICTAITHIFYTVVKGLVAFRKGSLVRQRSFIHSRGFVEDIF